MEADYSNLFYFKCFAGDNFEHEYRIWLVPAAFHDSLILAYKVHVMMPILDDGLAENVFMMIKK